MVRLPVSGVEYALRMPDGADDMLLHEFTGNAVAAGIMLLSRLAGPDIGALCITDFEVLLLALRAERFGEEVALGFACPHCRVLGELNFRVSALAASVAPRAVPGVVADAGWFLLAGARFRLPSAADQAAVIGRDQASRLLAGRCLDEACRKAPGRGVVERAMAAIAPAVSRRIAAFCPACQTGITVALHVARLVVAEFRRAAAFVHDEVDLIARAYHWPEAAILELPQVRRFAYAERIRRGQAGAA